MPRYTLSANLTLALIDLEEEHIAILRQGTATCRTAEKIQEVMAAWHAQIMENRREEARREAKQR